MTTTAAASAQRLVAAAACHAQADVERWRQRVERLLGMSLTSLTPAPFRSALNSSGMPLQWCLSFGPGPARSRLICDPAFTEAEPARRHAASLAAAQALCNEVGVGGVAAHVLGHARIATGASEVGPLWLAFGRAEEGVALYLNSRLGDDEGHLGGWFDFLDEVASPTARRAAVAWFDGHLHRLSAIGLDLSPTGVAALTLYCRPRSAQPGALAHFTGHGAGAALLCVLGGHSQPVTGVTVAVCVTVPDGRLKASKIDLCRCPRCHPHADGRAAAPAEWALVGQDPALAAVLAAYELPTHTSLALVGVAARGFRPHVNLYFEPRGEVVLRSGIGGCAS